MLSSNGIKKQAGEAAVQLVKEDMIIGIGSGSTVLYFIKAIGEKVRNGFKCTGVPTSEQTRLLAEENGIPVVELNDVPFIDITIDGADEIDSKLRLIKGGGGALLREKMVASASKDLVIIADNSKLKSELGAFPLPVEIIPYGWKQVQKKINEQWKIQTQLRMKNDIPFITDHGHYILDCHFREIRGPFALNSSLHQIAGVVETGLFIDMCIIALIAYPNGNVKSIDNAGKINSWNPTSRLESSEK